MKKLLILIIIGILIAQEEHKVAEEVIKAKAELKIEDALKPEGRFSLDPAEPVDSLLKETGLLRTTLDLTSLESSLFISFYTPTSYLRRPTSYKIPEEVLIPVPKTNIKVEVWRLVLIDSKGNEVWEIDGKGKPPETLLWNGEKKDGGVLIPGEPYTPVLYAFGQELRRRIIGEPLKMESFVINFGDSALIRFQTSSLFDSLREDLKAGAEERFTAILNWTKSYGATGIKVYIYSNNFMLREGRSEAIEEYIKKHFVSSENNLIILPCSFKEGERKYERVDFVLIKTVRK